MKYTEFKINEVLKLFNQIVRITTQTFDEKKPFDSVLELIHLLIPYESASLYLQSKDDKRLKLIATRGQVVNLADQFNFGKGRGLSAWVLKTGKPMLLSRIRKSSEFGESDIHSVILVPVKVREQNIGVLGFGHNIEGAFGEEDLKLAEFAAGAISSLILRIQDQQEIRKLNQVLRKKNRELRELRDELIKKERLAAIGRLSNTVAHLINNPLTAAFWQLELIEHQLQQKEDNTALEDLHELRESLVRISNEVKKIMKIEKEEIDDSSLPGLEMLKTAENF